MRRGSQQADPGGREAGVPWEFLLHWRERGGPQPAVRPRGAGG